MQTLNPRYTPYDVFWASVYSLAAALILYYVWIAPALAPDTDRAPTSTPWSRCIANTGDPAYCTEYMQYQRESRELQW